MILPEVQALIEHYKLTPLPLEGALYTRTYRSPTDLDDSQPHGTAIIGLYCDEPRSLSIFHKLPVDEVWHFYAGDPLRLVLLYPNGSSREVIMGNQPLNGQLVQFVVPAGVWQAGQVLPGGRYSLFGCTLAPGYTDEMFESTSREYLLAAYPDRADDIAVFNC